jgi:hypothetical protein
MGEMGHNGCWDCVRSRHGKATSKFHRPTIGLHVEYREFNFSKDMKINIWYSNQIGIMLTWGVQYEGRKYVSLDIPFLIIQVLSAIPKKLNEGIRESDHRERT